MSYKYETHLHTSTSSACGKSSGRDYISFYKDLGYSGIFVTDHFYLGNTCVDRNLPWTEWVDRYCRSYYEALEEGDKQGLSVFFGWETSYHGDDYLIYGMDDRWLRAHPEVRTWNAGEQYRVIHSEGGMVIQAHPFRERGYMNAIHLRPYDCDGWEIANGGNQPYQDALAYRYAVNHGLKITAGSDIHRAEIPGAGMVFGMEFDTPLTSAEDYVKRFLSGETGRPLYPEARAASSEIRPTSLPIYFHEKDGSSIQLDEAPC